MLRVSVLVSGGGTNLQAIIDAVESGRLPDVKIVSVISSSRNAYALERAGKHGIPAMVLSPRDYPDREQYARALIASLEETGTQLVVLAGFLVVIPPLVVEAYQNRIINIHPSLIPSFCGKGCYGLKVHEMALERGVKVTGATVHFVDSGTDTGPILLQKAVEVLPDDTPSVLQKRVMEEAEWKLLPEAIALIAADKVAVEGGRAVILTDREMRQRP